MAIHIDAGARLLELSVGDLVPAEEADPFAPSRGGWSRLAAGVRAHVEYAQERMQSDPGYEREKSLKVELQVQGWTVRVLGRVDGIERSPRDGALVVEELKSVILGEQAFQALHPGSYPAYVLQLRIYLYLMGLDAGSAPPPRGRLVFVNLPGREVRRFDVECGPGEMASLVGRRVGEILAEWEAGRRRLEERRALAPRLEFPFPGRRPQQVEMERACREALEAGRSLLVSAPPGLGKTAAALQAALAHALASDRRVYFVTSKTTEQRIVEATLERLTRAHPLLSAVVIRAKAKICANEVVFCHPEFCEYARDYPAKVQASQVREALMRLGLALPDLIYSRGVAARACPFELTLELTETADVVVGDYNYVFDPAVGLRRQFEEGSAEDLVLVVDEAHNLLDRAREYYSPVLGRGRVRELRALLEARPGAIYRDLDAWLGSLLALLARVEDEAREGEALIDPAGGPPSYRAPRELEAVRRLREELEGLLLHYLVFRRECGSVVPDDPVLEAAGEFLRFARVMELEGDELVYLFEPPLEGGREGGRYRILCLDPSRQLGKRIRSFHGVIAMSATLEPEEYYRDLLGFPRRRTDSLRLPSPFARENRRILVVPGVQTTWRERARYYDKAAHTIRALTGARAGHWIAFLPSFAYLGEIERRLEDLPGERLVQLASMDERARRAILARLERPDGRPRLLLAVLGGVFAEGVDLPGDAVEGIIVVSPGLPQVSLDRELLRQRFEEAYGKGFEYAYQLPGLNRVIQAAGRLVRGERDRGVVVLLDRRFASASYSRFFPRDWYERSPRELVVEDPVEEVRRFFAEGPA